MLNRPGRAYDNWRSLVFELAEGRLLSRQDDLLGSENGKPAITVTFQLPTSDPLAKPEPGTAMTIGLLAKLPRIDVSTHQGVHPYSEQWSHTTIDTVAAKQGGEQLIQELTVVASRLELRQVQHDVLGRAQHAHQQLRFEFDVNLVEQCGLHQFEIALNQHGCPPPAQAPIHCADALSCDVPRPTAAASCPARFVVRGCSTAGEFLLSSLPHRPRGQESRDNAGRAQDQRR